MSEESPSAQQAGPGLACAAAEPGAPESSGPDERAVAEDRTEPGDPPVEGEGEPAKTEALIPGAPEGPPEGPELEAGAGERLGDDELVRRVAALLFASPHPLTPRKLAELLERPRLVRLETALVELGRRFEAAGLPFELRRIAGGWHLFTAPDQGDVVARLAPGERTERLSAAGLETLAIVAYRQPVTKAEIEAIRGVQAGPMLRALVDRGLVKVLGRADLPGSPLQYGTTREFLDRFGLGSLDDLPRDGELL